LCMQKLDAKQMAAKSKRTSSNNNAPVRRRL
jgi:hypothetical protein